MSMTLYTKVDYSLAKLIEDIDMGELALPDIQRPFVWSASKVRDLFDSNYPRFLAGALRIFHSISSPSNRYEIIYKNKNLSNLDVETTIVLLVDYSKGNIEIPVRKHFEYGYRVIAFRKYTVEKLDPFKWSLRVLSIWERILEKIENEQEPFLYTYGYNNNRLYKKS